MSLDKWTEELRALKRFRQAFGHTLVPPNWKPNPRLAKWVATVRANFGDLSLDELEQLNRAGFDFGPADRYWMSRFFELARYKKRFGNCNVPAHWPGNPQLGSWIQGQRAHMRNIPLQRYRLFEKVGMDWSPLETAWNGQYEKLLAFKAEHGHCVVPDTSKYRPLSIWVGNTRARRHRLTDRQKLLLRRAGFVWNVSEAHWRDRVNELKAFRKRHGHCRVAPRFNKGLAGWLSALRKEKAGLPKGKIAELDRLGVEWDPRALRFEEGFAQLRKFKKKYGHCRVPMKNRRFLKLANFVGGLRMRRNEISSERRARLEKLGFDWRILEMSPRKDGETRFRELREFKRRFGHCEIPVDWPENRPLWHWISRQRGRDRSKMTADQRRRLEALGFTWNLRETKWKQMYARLVEYKRKHGVADVPYGSSDDELRRWILHHRYSKDRLTPERIRKFEAVGLTWRPKHMKA